MATTVDNLQVNVTVQGTAQLKETTAASDSLGNSVKATQEKMTASQMGVRNFSYQIQDMAVQLEMGTNAFRVMGQQLPQMLGSFGTLGVVLGAVVGVGFPLLSLGLKIAGIDMRNLKERTDDLTTSVEKFKAAQQANLPTIEGLRDRFGSLSEDAKKFFDLMEAMNKQKALTELSATIKQLQTDFTTAGYDLQTLMNTQGVSFEDAAMSASVLGASVSLLAFKTGLTAQQAEMLSDKLKKLDKESKPEDVLKVVNEIVESLKASGIETDKFLRVWEKVLEPLEKSANAALKFEENVKAAGESSSKLATTLMNMQAASIVKVGDAKRDFDYITSFAIEAQAKIAEYTVQSNEKTSKDGVNRQKEIAAFANKTNAERINAEKDFAKAQQETFYAQQLGNEQNERSVIAQKQINALKLDQIDSIKYESILEEGRIRNALAQVNALMAIEELRRKNAITEERADRLREQVAGIRKQSDAVAAQDAERIRAENERNIRIQVEGLALENSAKRKIFELEQATFSLSTLDQQARKQLLDIDIARDRAIQDLNNNSRLSEAEKLDALIRINDEYAKSKDLVKEQLKYNQDMQKDFGKGAEQRIKELTESFSQFKVAGMEVDAVWNDMSTALDNFVETGKFRFGDFAASVIKDLLKIELKASAMALFKAAGGGAGIMGGLGDIFGGIKGFLGLATGGPVSANTPYVVGEAGPELFLPNTSGSIVPNNRLGGQTVVNNHYITNQISAIDAKGVAQLFYENRQTLFGTVEQAKKELPFRQGAMI